MHADCQRDATARATADTPTASDIDDPSLEDILLTRGFTLGRPQDISLAPNGSAVLFLRSGPRDGTRDLFSVDVTTGVERTVATAAGLLGGATETLTVEERARRERMRLSASGIATYTLSPDGGLALVPLAGKLYLVDVGSGASRALPEQPARADEPPPIDARFSPDGHTIACVRDGDVYVIDVATGDERRLTTRPGPHIRYAEAEFVAQEEMDRFEGYWWSPDSHTLAIEESDDSAEETFHIADPAHPEADPATFPYPRAGRANARVRVGLVAARGGRITWTTWDHDHYPYLAKVVWPEHGSLTLLVQNRTQTEEVLLTVDTRAGTTRPLLTETDPAWLNLDPEMPKFLADGSFLWTTERPGAWTLEHHGADGHLLATLVRPEHGYRHLAHVDEAAGNVYFVASTDALESQVWRAPLAEEGAPAQLTHGAGEHDATFAEHAGVWVEGVDLADGTRASLVHRLDGSDGNPLVSRAEVPSRLPQPEVVTLPGDDRLRASIIRPRGFDEHRRYPVIDWVYGGPHYNQVRASPFKYLRQQWLADHGFVVVSIDGHGTPNRGHDWERAIAHDVITKPLADQVSGLRALAATRPWMDLSRTGITGWSFGGYFTTMAVMREPDVFRAGVAGAPVTDWRNYDTHYTERYMGLPDANAAGYDSTSCLVAAPTLSRPLLVVHGTADDNVYFLNSIQLADALLRAGKPFELLPLAGFTHMVPDPVVARRLDERTVTFFREHLGSPL